MLGVGVGTAAAAALEPLIEPGRQQAWSDHPNRVLDPGLMARLAAQGAVTLDAAHAAGKREGFDTDKLDALVYLAQRVPEWAQVRDLINRRLITADQRDAALQRHAYPAEWLGPLRALMQEILSPGELAAAIHRGLVPNPDILLGEQPQPPFNVDAYPVQPIDAVAEAAGSGYDKERLAVLVGLQGLPMGTHEAAQAFFRGIITHGDYIRAFNESNSRNEWAQAVLDYTRQIPTARDFMENALRGHHDFEWAAEQAARHGMSRDDAFLIYQNQGRPLNLHQITQGLAWGGKYNPAAGDDPDPWMQAVLLGAVRPEYYDLQHSLKYNLPSAFYFRALQEQAVMDETEAATWYKRLGWPPELADKVAAAYAKPAATQADPHVTKAQTQLWNQAHRSYIAREISDTVARNALGTAGVAATAQQAVLNLWQAERDLIRKQLTPAQVKKALAKGSRNAATGQPWTRDEALAWLVAYGYSANDANDFLDIP